MSDKKKLFNWRLYLLTSDLPATTRHVLLTLSMHMDEWGNSAFPTIDQLTYETGLSRRAVINHLQSATDSGWIVRNLHGFGGQKWRSNEYKPSIPKNAKLTPWKDTEAYQKSQKRGARNALASTSKKQNKAQEGGEPNAPRLSPEAGAGGTPAIDTKVVHLTTKGGASDDKGGAPNDTKVVHQMHPSTSVSSSISTSVSTTGSEQKKKPAKSSAVWESYSTAYRQRHQVEPVRNKKINSQLCQLVDRLGESAPEVAEFYVWHNNGFYVQRMHPVDLLVKDAESLHAQWQQGQQMTQTQARQIDKSQSNHSVIEGVIAKRNAKRGEV